MKLCIITAHKKRQKHFVQKAPHKMLVYLSTGLLYNHYKSVESYLNGILTEKKFPDRSCSYKTFFFANKEFLWFLLLSQVILLLSVTFYSLCYNTLKLNRENWKTKKKKFYRIGPR